MPEPSLACESLSAAYNGTPVLADVSLSLAEGELVGVVGPNGSGKSTLARALVGALSPAVGVVRLAGRPIDSYAPRERARLLAYLPQEVTVPFDVSVLEVVLLGRLARKRGLSFAVREDIEAANEAMRFAGVDGLAERSILSLSGGERRRAFIAMVVAQGAPTWVLDEPVAALDVRHAWEVFERIRASPAAKLVVVHDVAIAAACCDRVLLLSGGRVIALGEARAVLTEENLERAYGVAVERLVGAGTGRVAFLPRGK